MLQLCGNPCKSSFDKLITNICLAQQLQQLQRRAEGEGLL
jgi:hypothetical protein